MDMSEEKSYARLAKTVLAHPRWRQPARSMLNEVGSLFT